jgi:hypothetical protein
VNLHYSDSGKTTVIPAQGQKCQFDEPAQGIEGKLPYRVPVYGLQAARAFLVPVARRLIVEAGLFEQLARRVVSETSGRSVFVGSFVSRPSRSRSYFRIRPAAISVSL